ncbi:MAG: zinc ribbon domain-containing protein [Lachnospiraceae bacterium]|nr:zinc ribbon domain-containing protein [Lachnospiraceae bacterium]
MFCSNCGKEIRDNSNFCPYCGVVKRAIPSETVKQTPVQDTSVSVKKNGSKVFKFCPNCGKAIGENSAFCPYCGSAERAIPSKTVEQTPVQNTSVAAWQSRFKDFWKRKWSEDKQAVVVSSLLVLSIVCIVVYGYLKNRYQEAIIGNLVNFSGAYVGDEIYVEGWVVRSKEDGFFLVYDTPSHDSDWVIVDGRALEKIPERGTTVTVRGEWVQSGGDYWLEADKIGFVDYEDLLYRYERVDVADLILYPDTYMGKCVRVTGEVSLAAQGSFMVGEKGSVPGVWVEDDEDHFINGEEVTVYGVVTNDGGVDIKLVRQYAMPGKGHHDTKIRAGG